ncbi:hypothetical protein ACJ41O_010738 [Fusarium nematophilum]
MCFLLELEFACSDDAGPHRLRTEAIIKCESPISCLYDEIAGTTPEPSEVKLEDLPSGKFKVLHVGGDCDKCARVKTSQLANNVDILDEIGETITQIDKDLDQLDLVPRVPRPARHRPKTTCSSGSCKQVTVWVGGRQGHFCQKHTCAAKDWGCLNDVSTNSNSDQHSIYCPEHTCVWPGCGLRVAERYKGVCERHLRQCGFL